MTKSIFLILSLLVFCTTSFSQKIEPLDYDICKDNIPKKSLRKFYDAYSLYEKGKLNEASNILRELIAQEPDFASAYFLIGMIGVKKNNSTTIEKFFPKILEICPEYSNPLVYYYNGLIDYTYERFETSKKNFEQFISLAQEDSDRYYDLITEADNYLQWSEFLENTKNNPTDFNPKKIINISTKENEYYPFITLDKEKIFFTREVEIKSNKNDSFYEEISSEVKEFLYMSTLQNNSTYDKGFALEEPFEDINISSRVSLTADNREMYFTLCKKENNFINCDIYYSEWLGEYWSNATNLGSIINGANSQESQPCISPDGKTLYFTSNRPSGIGGLDIWISKKSSSGNWNRPFNAGPRINTTANEQSPFLHPDGVSFYFTSNGWKSVGGYDIFYLKLDNKKMNEPKNLGYPINTEDDESGIFVTLDNEAYFASNTIGGTNNWDIYTFELDKKIQPLASKLVKGNIFEVDSEPVGAVLEVTRLSDKSKNIYDIDPKTGKFAVVLLNGEDYLLKAKKEGYAFESRYLKTNNIHKSIDLALNPLKVNESYVIKDVNFATNSYDLTPESQEIIDAFIEFLNEYPKIRCTIEGHTDNVGSEENNYTLSLNRAKAVAEYITKSRIREDRVSFEGFGSKNTISDNNTEEGRAKNRRTVFRIDSM